MSYSDDEDNNDNINEYNTDSDSDDWGEEEQKTKLLSKKEKQTIAFQTVIRTAKTHFNNSEYLNFQQDLKSINNQIMTNKWSKKAYQMPKFFVKHMFEIYNKIQELDPEKEQNQKEQTALKKLKKNFAKDLKHFKQLDVYNKNPNIGKWSNENSDLGEEENEEDMESSENDALFQIADTADAQDDKDDDDAGDDDNGDEDASDNEEEDDYEDSDELSSWGSWEDNKVDVKPAESEPESDVDEDVGDAKDDDKPKESKFGSDAFDDETLAKMRHRSFWVLKQKRKGPKKKTQKQIRREEREEAERKKAEEEAERKKKEPSEKKDEKKTRKEEKKKKKHGPTKWSVTRINQIFQSVLADRGKINVNRDQIVNHLEELMEQCGLHNAEQARLTVISVLISFYFDTASRKTTGQSGTRWRKTRALISTMLTSLRKNFSTFRVSNDADIRLILKEESDVKKENDNANLEWMKALEGGGDDTGSKKESGPFGLGVIGGGFSVIEAKKKKKLDPKYQWIHGNLLSYIKKLTVELWTNLKSLSSKPKLYEKRLKNRELLLNTFKKAVVYYGKLEEYKIQSEIEVLAMKVIHNDYNEKLDLLNAKNKDEQKKQSKKKKIKFNYKGSECEILNLPMSSTMVQKAIFIFEHGTTRSATAAMLYLIFNMSIHNRYELCRDLLLMSHLGDNNRIGITSIELQILYNRSLAAYSICSFIYGHWYSCMIILQELFSSGRYKILLAQGYTKAPIDDPKTTQEMIKVAQIQQQRMLPQHFHINNDLLEAAHLLSSLFIEIPNLMTNIYQSSGFIKNAYFRKVWHQYLRRDLRVPPENTKDYILQCGIYMQNGEWIKCKEIIKKLKLFANNEVKHPKYVIKKLYSTIKRECLRCYLYRYGSCYKDISLKFLSEMFNLSLEHTKQFISKLIITNHSKDIKFASFDELTQCIIIHQIPPKQIQKNALEYSDKLSFLIEQNMKLLGIHSRYGGGGGSKYQKHNKFHQQDSKYQKDNKNKHHMKNKNKNKNMKNTRNRFGRSSHSGNKQSDQFVSEKQNNSKRQFGSIQSNRTQLRSRPKGR